MSINKITKFAFAAVSVGALSIAVGSSLVTSANSQNSNSFNSQFEQKSKEKNKSGFAGWEKGMKGGKSGGKMMGKMGEKMEAEAIKYKIDTNLIQEVKDAQKVAEETKNALRLARSNKSDNVSELEKQLKENHKNLAQNINKFQITLFEAKITEAKTLGVEQSIIDKFAANHKLKTETMAKINELKNNPETKIGEIEVLRDILKQNKQTFYENQKTFQNAVKSKTQSTTSAIVASQN